MRRRFMLGALLSFASLCRNMDFENWTLPASLVTDEARAFFFGLFTGAFVRLFRATLRWFKRAGTERDE